MVQIGAQQFFPWIFHLEIHIIESTGNQFVADAIKNAFDIVFTSWDFTYTSQCLKGGGALAGKMRTVSI